jgi:2',3'-cyclic-nucleotide 2'-phosphodiesterase (5'-nucleotidase family)
MIRILHTNDMHGTMGESEYLKLRALRDNCDLYFDTGDIIKTGNLGIPLSQEPAWNYLKRLECTASVLGNRETHPLEPIFLRKIAGASTPLLCGNLIKKDQSNPLLTRLILESKGLKVGVISTMVAIVTEKMSTKIASSYLWHNPISTLILQAKELKREVDLVVALTHIGYKNDIKLAEQSSDIDVIFGGHSHTVLHSPTLVKSTYIAQGGSHNRFAGVYEWSEQKLTGELVQIRN